MTEAELRLAFDLPPKSDGVCVLCFICLAANAPWLYLIAYVVTGCFSGSSVPLVISE
jgi:hypothetical protein